ncbi:MAG: PASTA domain-containing protein [Oscillospiraceae bacterium]
MSRQTTTRRRHGVRRMSERKRLTITAITAVLALVTVVICALSGVFNFHKGNERILPNLVGQTEESAKAQLAELDAEPSITYENSDETKGIVIRQDVNEGTQLKHRQTVAFVVSLGPKEQPAARGHPVAIPSFVGLTLEQAQATAKSLGVTVEAGGTVYDDNVRKGSVARRTRSAARWSPGTTIQVSISAGPEKKEYTVTVTCGAGGSVSPSGNQKVAEGGSVSFTITPKEGYEVATLVIDGTTVLPLTSYSFMNVDSNHTLYVTFREK